VVAPTHGFFFQSLPLSDTPLQALPGKSRELDLSHIEPTPFYWGIVQFEFLSPRESFLRGKSVVKRTRSMGVQVVLDKLNTSYSRVIRFHKFFHECGVVNRGALLADLDKTPAPQRLEGEQNTTGALALRFVILTFGPARFQRYRRKNSAQELTGPFSKTYYWT